jgi:hypothetical protein
MIRRYFLLSLIFLAFGFGVSNASEQEIIIQIDFFQVVPAPEPNNYKYGISTFMRSNQTITKKFGRFSRMVDYNLSEKNTIEHIRELVEEVRQRIPNINYMQIVAIDYIIK